MHQDAGTQPTEPRPAQVARDRVRRTLYDQLCTDLQSSLPPSPPACEHSPKLDPSAHPPASPPRAVWSLNGVSNLLNAFLEPVALALVLIRHGLCSGANTVLVPPCDGAVVCYTALEAVLNFTAYTMVGAVTTCLAVLIHPAARAIKLLASSPSAR
eukprot:6206935-Pleurochrysis_carterae.AAC.1